MKVILLEKIKSYTEKQGFKVAALGAFPTAYSLAASLGTEKLLREIIERGHIIVLINKRFHCSRICGCTIRDNSAICFRDEVFDCLAGGRETLADFMICIDCKA